MLDKMNKQICHDCNEVICADLQICPACLNGKLPSEMLAINMKLLRQYNAHTQEDLSEMIGMSRASVANLEAGRQGVTLNQACKIAKALDTNIESLLTPLALK